MADDGIFRLFFAFDCGVQSKEVLELNSAAVDAKDRLPHSSPALDVASALPAHSKRMHNPCDG